MGPVLGLKGIFRVSFHCLESRAYTSPHHPLLASQSSCAFSSPPLVPVPGLALSPSPGLAPGLCPVPDHVHVPGTSRAPCPEVFWLWKEHNPQCLQKCWEKQVPLIAKIIHTQAGHLS